MWSVLSCDWSVCEQLRHVFQKLKAIEELKEMQASGKVLQKNQVTDHGPDQKCVNVQLICVCVFQLEKMQKEEVLLQELQELQITP